MKKFIVVFNIILTLIVLCLCIKHGNMLAVAACLNALCGWLCAGGGVYNDK